MVESMLSAHRVPLDVGFNAGASLGSWQTALGQCRVARMAPLLMLYAQAN